MREQETAPTHHHADRAEADHRIGGQSGSHRAASYAARNRYLQPGARRATSEPESRRNASASYVPRMKLEHLARLRPRGMLADCYCVRNLTSGAEKQK